MNLRLTDGTFRRREALLIVLAVLAGCSTRNVPYGVESKVSVSASRGTTWAVAPVLNLSGQTSIDPLLHADIVFQQLQQIDGITAIPVDQVVAVFAAVGLQQVQNAEQAAIVCELLGADALLVPTVTAWDPYNPPKMGATLTLFAQPGSFVMDTSVDPAELVRRATPGGGTGGTGGDGGGIGGGCRRWRTRASCRRPGCTMPPTGRCVKPCCGTPTGVRTRSGRGERGSISSIRTSMRRSCIGS